MQKWEYLFILAEKYKDEWRPEIINGQQLENWSSGKNIYEYSNEMGQQGWELVSTPYTATDFGLRIRLVFKRPIE